MFKPSEIKSANPFTHYIAATFIIVAQFAVSPAGVALIHQYPHLGELAGLLTGLAALYHKSS